MEPTFSLVLHPFKDSSKQLCFLIQQDVGQFNVRCIPIFIWNVLGSNCRTSTELLKNVWINSTPCGWVFRNNCVFQNWNNPISLEMTRHNLLHYYLFFNDISTSSTAYTVDLSLNKIQTGHSVTHHSNILIQTQVFWITCIRFSLLPSCWPHRSHIFPWGLLPHMFEVV